MLSSTSVASKLPVMFCVTAPVAQTAFSGSIRAGQALSTAKTLRMLETPASRRASLAFAQNCC